MNRVDNVDNVKKASISMQQFDPAVLAQLFDLLGLEHPGLGKLKASADAVTESLPMDARPVDWLHQLFVASDIRGVQAAQIPWRRFNQSLMPALISYQDNWYLAQHAEDESISLTDSDGNQQIVAEELLQDAMVLWLRHSKRKRPLKSFSIKNNIAAGLVWRELFREPRWLWSVLVATLVINVLAVGNSIFALQVYDRVVPTQAYATLTTLVMAMAIIISLDWFLKTLRARIVDSVSCAVDKRVSQKVFDHLLHIQLDMQPKSLGTLAAQVSGLDSVRQFISSTAILILLDLPFALFFIGMIALIGGNVAWVYVVLFPIALAIGFFAQYRQRRLMREQMMRHNERQGLLVDTIRGAESIRSNNSTWRFSQQWHQVTESIDGYHVQNKAISSFSTITIMSMAAMAYVLAIVVGVFEIEAGNLTMGGLIASSILGGRVIGPISQSASQIAQWQNVSQSLQMVNEVLQLNPERREDQQLLMPDLVPETIQLDQVQFAYPDSPIQQIKVDQLSFKKGDRVLLLGPIGCGKSTLLKLIAGLYRPQEGRIRLGDADLWAIDPQVVALHVSYLPQSVHLFKGTLRSNLALSGMATDSTLVQITKELGIDAIAAGNTMGMDMPISEGGEGLSGGQKQLVALGRLMINQPRIWLLDEPTASLDNESEVKVWQTLDKYVSKDDILIVATHKPMQAMKLANRVIVVQNGEVARDGSPEAVLAQMQSRTTAPPTTPKAGGRASVI